MRPAQFGTHCVPNWKTLEKQAHVPQVALIKTSPELSRQTLGKYSQLLCAIGSARLPLLFVLDNQAANFPVAGNHGLIDALAHLVARLLDDLCNPAGQCCHGVVLWG